MGRNSVSSGESAALYSIRDRFPFKRYHNTTTTAAGVARSSKDAAQPLHKTSRSYHHHHKRKFSLSSFKCKSWFYLCILMVIFAFGLASMVLQIPIMSVFLFQPGSAVERMRWRWSVKEELELGCSLEFVPQRWRKVNENRLDWLRTLPRNGVRPPRIGLIIGNMKKDPSTLMLFSVIKNLKGLGYMFQICALGDGAALSVWEEIGGQVSILSPERFGYIDWSIFEGVIVDSLEAKDAISSLMQEPFCSVPLILIIQEDTLANRLQQYEKMGWDHLISNWKNAFSRADAVVFPEFSYPMLYSVLDTGNFFVIPGSPLDVWAAESYSKTHSKHQLREEYGFDNDDLLILVVGSSFFYSELAWDYAVTIQDLEPILHTYARSNDDNDFKTKFIFLFGNSSKNYNDGLRDVSARLRLHEGSLKHYGMNSDVNGVILMSDIILYCSSQDEQGFPPLLARAMSFGIPVVAPDNSVIKNYIVDGVHGIIFRKKDPTVLKDALSVLVSENKLSRYAQSVASTGRLHAKNMLAAECFTGYAELLEYVFDFPSDVVLPSEASHLNSNIWEWNLFRRELDWVSGKTETLHQEFFLGMNSSIVYNLEEGMSKTASKVSTWNKSEELEEDFPTISDWNILNEMESAEEVEMLESEEIDERMEKDIGEWDDIYRNARKSEKLSFETNERDEGELERTGQPLCIYEVYDGAGGWPFLHHGSLYRGLSLSTKARRLSSDDVDAVDHLPILNETSYRDILCEMGGMFALASVIDDIHKKRWIGFQSWHAAGRKVSLSRKAEEVLEKAVQENTKGDVIYFWAILDMDHAKAGKDDIPTFWSACDIMNAGRCRMAFEETFRRMYGLPSSFKALPPMPDDTGHWSVLHSWVMPTPSYLEFIMFSRMFVDSLHGLHMNSNETSGCLVGSSRHEKRQCYCRLLELLVNIWAYHSARKMVYIDPQSGSLREQHPVEQRKLLMWVKYFNETLLQSMDQDLAEAADDGDHPYKNWLWPLTGEVYWQGVYEREREQRYRMKMDKKRKTKEKLLDRLKHGYKQRTLAG